MVLVGKTSESLRPNYMLYKVNAERKLSSEIGVLVGMYNLAFSAETILNFWLAQLLAWSCRLKIQNYGGIEW